MTYRARCLGRKGKHGRRWFTLDPYGKKGKRYWLVTGYHKLGDIQANADGKEIEAHIRALRLAEETPGNGDCGSCDPAPYVCPGCHAVGGERCAPGCIDAEIAAKDEWAYENEATDDSGKSEGGT